jgi:hypothetical protein
MRSASRWTFLGLALLCPLSTAWASAFGNPVPYTGKGDQSLQLSGGGIRRIVASGDEEVNLGVERGRLTYVYATSEKGQIGGFAGAVSFLIDVGEISGQGAGQGGEESAGGWEAGFLGRRLLIKGETISQGLQFQVSTARGAGKGFTIDFTWADLAYGASFDLDAQLRLYAATWYGYGEGTVKADQGGNDILKTTSGLGVYFGAEYLPIDPLTLGAEVRAGVETGVSLLARYTF